jgi:hypothetical protein
MWAPRVAPVEHQGVLVRIHGASGTLFDPTFFRYQVSELTRLKQIVCEVFVTEGLEAALNIDRESFNAAHPHMVYLTKWLHGALRQLATTQKKVASELRRSRRITEQSDFQARVSGIAERVWLQVGPRDHEEPPEVDLGLKVSDRLSEGHAIRVDPRSVEDLGMEEESSAQLKAIIQLLSAFGLWDSLERNHQELLARSIAEVLQSPTMRRA